MNMKQILAYAVVGAKHEQQELLRRIPFEVDSDVKEIIKFRAEKRLKDYEEMRDMYRKHSDLLKNWEVLL